MSDILRLDIKGLLNEKRDAFKQQYRLALAHVQHLPDPVDDWDDNAHLVAAINVSRAARLAVEVIVLKKAAAHR